ncbi:MAG TPA: hypothetical protein VF859_09875 [Burkholderiales bacterium]
MAISHAEFRRTLVQAFGASVAPLGAQEFRVERPDGAAHLTLGPEKTRRIASLSYPVTVVSIAFEGLAGASADRFMARFYQYFQRGGG